ncbi:MAG: APC family permease [Actinomycetota bacterium]
MTAHLLPRSISTATSAVIGATSIAPLYSAVVTVGLIYALVGAWTPLVLATAVVPMVVVSVCFARLDALYEDQGTVYRWAREAFGAFAGFLGGWGLWLSATLVLASLAWVTADSALFALGIGAGPWATTAVAALLMAVFAAASATGIRISAAVQWVLAALQLIGVGVLVWAVRTAPVLEAGAVTEEGEWTGFYTAAELVAGSGVGAGDVAAALLLALFLYWGWDSTFSLTEESTTQRAPRVSAWIALAVVASAYVLIGWAYVPGAQVASPLLASLVAVSAGASIGTTMIPTSRGLMSMARGGHLPRRFASLSFATWTTAAVAAAWMAFSGPLFDDSIGIISVLVALYYGLACAAVLKLGRSAGARALGAAGVVLMGLALVLTGWEYLLSATWVWVGAVLVLLVVPLWFLLGRGRNPLPGAHERAPHLESLRN